MATSRATWTNSTPGPCRRTCGGTAGRSRCSPLGGHRVGLKAVTVPSFELILAAPGADPLAALQHAAARSTADVLVVLAFAPVQSGERWTEELAAIAALPDSGLCAPLLLSREGWVLESGRTRAGRPIMRGFDPLGDGYNGSLPCRREVDAVGPLCFAVRRELRPTAGESWPEFSARLGRAGLFHRICPGGAAADRARLAGQVAAEALAATDAFLNPQFDGGRADYSLADLPPRRAVSDRGKAGLIFPSHLSMINEPCSSGPPSPSSSGGTGAISSCAPGGKGRP